MGLVQKALWRIEDTFVSIVVCRLLPRRGLRFGKNTKFYGYPCISLFPNSRIVVGHHSVFSSRSASSVLGCNHEVILRTLKAGSEIVIGNNVGMTGATVCAASSVTVCDDVLIGANAIIVDTDFHPLDPAARQSCMSVNDGSTSPVYISRGVFIGTGALILKGVTLGEYSVIGAGSVVTRNVAAYSVVAGNPARLVRTLNRPDTGAGAINNE